MKKTNILIVTLILVFLSSCSTAENNPTAPTAQTPDPSGGGYSATILPSETSELFVASGDTNAVNVLLFVQGGPSFSLTTTNLDAFTSSSDYLKVYVHQAQTYNSALSNMTLTLEEASLEDEVSVDILHRVITYYKSLNKTVYVLAHSFGGAIVSKYLADYGNEADRIAILGSRLELPEVVWKGLSEGTFYVFIGGTTPQEVSQDLSQLTIFRFVAGLFMNRYTTLLNNVELSEVIYVYGTADQTLGILTQAELTFLQSKSVTVIPIPGGDHNSMLTGTNATTIFTSLTN